MFCFLAITYVVVRGMVMEHCLIMYLYHTHAFTEWGRVTSRVKTFTVDTCSLGFCYQMFIFLGYDYETWVKKQKSACILHLGFLSLALVITHLFIQQVGMEVGITISSIH